MFASLGGHGSSADTAGSASLAGRVLDSTAEEERTEVARLVSSAFRAGQNSTQRRRAVLHALEGERDAPRRDDPVVLGADQELEVRLLVARREVEALAQARRHGEAVEL